MLLANSDKILSYTQDTIFVLVYRRCRSAHQDVSFYSKSKLERRSEVCFIGVVMSRSLIVGEMVKS